jgi:hypothetical protein
MLLYRVVDVTGDNNRTMLALEVDDVDDADLLLLAHWQRCKWDLQIQRCRT